MILCIQKLREAQFFGCAVIISFWVSSPQTFTEGERNCLPNSNSHEFNHNFKEDAKDALI